MEATAKLKAVKKVSFPHTFIIIFALIVVAVLLTWIIPAGMYDFVKGPGDKKVLDPATFHYVAQSGINPLKIPLYIMKAMNKRIDLMMVILMAGAAFHIVTKSGSLQAILAMGARKFSDRLEIFLPA